MSSRIGSVLIALLGLTLIAADRPINIVGVYACEGENADGGKYTGKVEITKNGDAYKVEWTIGQAEGYEGVGIRNGNVLSVSWKSGNASGLVVYTIDKGEKGAKLSGKWSPNPGDGKLFNENLTYEKGASQ
jgi:hypothetical protein